MAVGGHNGAVNGEAGDSDPSLTSLPIYDTGSFSILQIPRD